VKEGHDCDENQTGIRTTVRLLKAGFREEGFLSEVKAEANWRHQALVA
jgi:hypothetical protein